MDNLRIHIVLPKGLALVSGAALSEDVSFQVIGRLTPWYCSVDQVKLEGGIYLTKVPDMTIACQIWQASKDADAISYNLPPSPLPGAPDTDLSVRRYKLWLHARQSYVAQRAAWDMTQRVYDLMGTRGSKTLANFSIAKMAFGRDEGMPKHLNNLQTEFKQWEVVLKSGADVGPGGRPRAKMASKGMYDPASPPPGRLWETTGMGANLTSVPGYGSNGAPVKYGSPTFIDWYAGRWRGSHLSASVALSF